MHMARCVRRDEPREVSRVGHPLASSLETFVLQAHKIKLKSHSGGNKHLASTRSQYGQLKRLFLRHETNSETTEVGAS